jgi:hypothetical protein
MERNLRGTRQAAQLLGIPPNRLNRAVWDGRLAPPAKAPSGAFLWTEMDIRRAAWALLRRDLDDVANRQGGNCAE